MMSMKILFVFLLSALVFAEDFVEDAIENNEDLLRQELGELKGTNENLLEALKSLTADEDQGEEKDNGIPPSKELIEKLLQNIEEGSQGTFDFETQVAGISKCPRGWFKVAGSATCCRDKKPGNGVGVCCNMDGRSRCFCNNKLLAPVLKQGARGQPNGCGSDESIWPKWIAQLFSLELISACNRHDRCYTDCTKSQTKCDTDWLRESIAICRRDYKIRSNLWWCFRRVMFGYDQMKDNTAWMVSMGNSCSCTNCDYCVKKFAAADGCKVWGKNGKFPSELLPRDADCSSCHLPHATYCRGSGECDWCVKTLDAKGGCKDYFLANLKARLPEHCSACERKAFTYCQRKYGTPYLLIKPNAYCHNRGSIAGRDGRYSKKVANINACYAFVKSSSSCGEFFSLGVYDGWCDCVPVGSTCGTRSFRNYNTFKRTNYKN